MIENGIITAIGATLATAESWKNTLPCYATKNNTDSSKR